MVPDNISCRWVNMCLAFVKAVEEEPYFACTPSNSQKLTQAFCDSFYNAFLAYADRPVFVLLKDICMQEMAFTIQDNALPVEPSISVNATGYDQLNANIALRLTYTGSQNSTFCFPQTSVGIPGMQCPQDCTKCTPTTSSKLLFYYPNSLKSAGTCGSCAFWQCKLTLNKESQYRGWAFIYVCKV